MLVNGPLPVSQNDQVGKLDSSFRPNQRVVAEVIHVTGTQVILSVNGTPIVARLTSPEQAIALKEQRLARFIITQADENIINFKLILPNQAQSTEMAGMRQDLLSRFLADLNLTASDKNGLLIQSMLNHQLPVNSELFNALNAVLTELGTWDANVADLAAAIKAAGLPLTPESLALAVRASGGLENIENLYQLMKEIAGREGLPADFRTLLETGMKLLDEARIFAGAPRSELAKAIENQILLNGRSLENIIKEQVESKNPFWPEKSLAVFSRLQNLATTHGEKELSQMLSKYLDQTHLAQFWNIQPQQAPIAEKWLEFPIFVQIPQPNGGENGEPAQLRILRNPDQSEEGVDPENTRLVIEMEVSPGKTVQVNLALTGKQMWNDVVVTDEQLLEFARQELPELEQGLQELGYDLTQNNLRIGKINRLPAQSILPAGKSSAAVDLEV